MTRFHALSARAQQGAAFLDEREPGWFLTINLGGLQMDQGSTPAGAEKTGCVLCQLSLPDENGRRWWFDKQMELNIDDDDCDTLGFVSHTHDYGLLTEAWVQEIQSRLDAALPQNR